MMYVHMIRIGGYSSRIGGGAPVYVAAVLEYIAGQVLEQAATVVAAAGDSTTNGTRCIQPRHLAAALKGNPDLAAMLQQMNGKLSQYFLSLVYQILNNKSVNCLCYPIDDQKGDSDADTASTASTDDDDDDKSSNDTNNNNNNNEDDNTEEKASSDNDNDEDDDDDNDNDNNNDDDTSTAPRHVPSVPSFATLPITPMPLNNNVTSSTSSPTSSNSQRKRHRSAATSHHESVIPTSTSSQSSKRSRTRVTLESLPPLPPLPMTATTAQRKFDPTALG
jgi:hypothetical protein